MTVCYALQFALLSLTNKSCEAKQDNSSPPFCHRRAIRRQLIRNQAQKVGTTIHGLFAARINFMFAIYNNAESKFYILFLFVFNRKDMKDLPEFHKKQLTFA